MKKLIVVNGSYRPNGTTSRCLEKVSARLCEKHSLEPTNFFLDNDIRGCVNCGPGKCQAWCRYEDQFQTIASEIEDAERVLLGSPVYLDFPSPKLLAFLSRLTSLAENTGREFFRNKHVHIHTNGYVSGTKAAAHVIMGACEMLGFTLDGRCTTEYIERWSDQKIRGGMTQVDACWLE